MPDLDGLACLDLHLLNMSGECGVAYLDGMRAGGQVHDAQWRAYAAALAIDQDLAPPGGSELDAAGGFLSARAAVFFAGCSAFGAAGLVDATTGASETAVA